MEIAPKLFDECTVKYKQNRQIERKKLADREDAWIKLEASATENAGKLSAHLQNVSLNSGPGILRPVRSKLYRY